MKQIRFTKEGLDKLKRDYDELLIQRPSAVGHLKKAREMGDLSENGYYKASRAKLSFIDSQLRKLSHQIKYARIVNKSGGNEIGIGSTVTLFDGKKEVTYAIVGDLEANPSQGRISLLSPLGQAIEGKAINKEVAIQTPNGKQSYRIIRVTTE